MKCGRNRPIEYFAMSVVSCCTAAPNINTVIWRYEFVNHVGRSYPSMCVLDVVGLVLNFDWIISIADICKIAKHHKNNNKIREEM